MQTARILWVENGQFRATMPSGHTVAFDCDRRRNSAPGAMEMLLGALGTCTGSDVALILKKKRQKLAGLEVTVSGERAGKPSAVWTKIEMVYRLKGDLNEKAVRDAIALSQSKYCSVAAMLGKTASIAYRYEIDR